MPESLFNQPSMAISNVFWMSLAPSLTNNATAINTIIKEITGSHFSDVFTWSDNLRATHADNFKAAARPAIKANNENTATIKPVLYPFMSAPINTMIKKISKQIYFNGSAILLRLCLSPFHRLYRLTFYWQHPSLCPYLLPIWLLFLK